MGTVVVEGEAPATLDKFQVSLEWQGPLFSSSQSSGPVDEDGKFVLTNLSPLRYQVQFANIPEGAYVKSIRLGDREVGEEGIDLTSGVAGTLEVTLSLGAAQVDGLVRDEDDKPVAGATVLLVPNSGHHRLFKEARASQDGRFSFKGIAPGEYRILAWESIEPGTHEDPQYLKQYDSQAQPVSLKENDRKTLQFKVIPRDNPRGR